MGWMTQRDDFRAELKYSPVREYFRLGTTQKEDGSLTHRKTISNAGNNIKIMFRRHA